MSRKPNQNDAGLTEAKVDPGKMTADANVATCEDSLNVHGPEHEFDAKQDVNSGTVLKQAKMADVISGAFNADGGNSGMGITAAGTKSSSGNTQGISSNLSRTTEGVNTRKENGTRFDKKSEKVATYINDTPSERINLEFEESKPLAENQSTVGFAGNYRSELYVNTKAAGAVPMSREYSRSVDIIEKDMVYFSQGQVIKAPGDNQNGTPTYSINEDENYIQITPATTSNFLHTKLNVQYDKNHKVVVMNCDVDELPVNVKDGSILDASAQNFYTSINQAELDRKAMDAKVGDETSKDWCPIPRMVSNGERIIMLSKDMEAMAGAEVYTMYKKFETSRAYQLNRAVKDGQQLFYPINEWLTGSYKARSTSEEFNIAGDDMSKVFNQDEYSKGSAAIFIDAFDSKSKYSKKADFLLQPRSFRLHVPTIKNSIKMFKVDPRFVKTYLKRECFSTLDGEYDGLKPILMTDKATLIHKHNMNQLFKVGFNKVSMSFKTGSGSDKTKLFSVKDITKKGLGLYVPTTHVSDYTISFDSTDNRIVITIADNKTVTDEKWIWDTADAVITNYSMISNSDTIEWEKYDIVTVGAGGEDTYLPDLVVPTDGVRIIRDSVPGYKYTKNFNKYSSYIRFYFLEGIYEMLNDVNSNTFASKLGGRPWKIPMLHSVVGLSTWDLIIATSLKNMLEVRGHAYQDFIDYEDKFGLPYSGVVKMNEVIDENFSNFSMSDGDNPLVLGALNAEEKYKWRFPEYLWKFGKIQSTGFSEIDYDASKWNTKEQRIYKFTPNDVGKILSYKLSPGDDSPTINIAGSVGKYTMTITKPAQDQTYDAFSVQFSIADTAPAGYTSVGTIGTASKNKYLVVKNGCGISIPEDQTGVLLPMYETSANYKYGKRDDDEPANHFYRDPDAFNTAYPNLRKCITLDALKDIYTKDERQYRLDLDRITDFTSHFEQDGSNAKITNICAYRYANIDDGLCAMWYNGKITVKDWLCLPRELGWSMDAPARLLTPACGFDGIDTLDHDAAGSTSFRIKCYHYANAHANNNLHDSVSLTTLRASVYKQNWIMIQNVEGRGNLTNVYNIFYCRAQSLDEYGEDVLGVNIFKPFTKVDSLSQPDGAYSVSIKNNAAINLSIMNVMPFVINPFDGVNQLTGEPSGLDIYEFAHTYGLCGFRDSDYSEDLTNKANKIDNLGDKYVMDEWFADSCFSK